VNRTAIILLALTMPSVVAASDQPDSSPAVRFSLYAPPQKDSPVQIVGFRNNRSVIQFVLSNASDKAVAAVLIGHADIAPLGCSSTLSENPHDLLKHSGAAGFKVSLPPHGKSVAGRAGVFMIGKGASPINPHWPRMFVDTARWANASYMQLQFGVTGVLFEDGTAWPAQIAFLSTSDFDPEKKSSPAEATAMSGVSNPDTFDPMLVKAEAGKCSEVTTVASALQLVKEVVFGPEAPLTPDPDDADSTIPHLRFSCSLDGSRAVCRLPFNPPDGISTKSHQNDK
jgi:hypothetical protein